MNNKHIKQLEFQMQNNDLHAQLATLLDLVREDICLKGWNKKHDKIIKGVVEDLMFVHNRYRASFKPKNRLNRD